MSTPPSIAARAPALLPGCAITNRPRRCATSVAARTISTGITTIVVGAADEPVKSLIPSAPRSSVASAIAATAETLVASGSRAGRM
jgi:hypothetical protein